MCINRNQSEPLIVIMLSGIFVAVLVPAVSSLARALDLPRITVLAIVLAVPVVVVLSMYAYTRIADAIDHRRFFQHSKSPHPGPLPKGKGEN